MPKVKVVDGTGKGIGEVELADDVFGIKPNTSVVHEVVQAQLAAERSGTASTKTRAEVRGGGVKPWRQKGTGRARAGSIRSPLWKGGGTVFGPVPRSYAKSVNKKVKSLGFRSILSAKVADGELIVFDKVDFDKPATKKGAELLECLKVEGTATVLLTPEQENLEKSLRNIPGATVVYTNGVNAYDLVRNKNMVASRQALEALEEAFKRERS